MFGFSTLTTLATLALACVSVSARSVAPRAPPAGWAYGYLEDYHTYHIRYMAISCQTQHGKQFFDDCCHPMLAIETLEKNRPKNCVPSAQASSSASRVEPTANPTSIAPPPGKTVFSVAPTSTQAQSIQAAQPTSSPAPVEDDEEECEEDDEDDDDEDCEDEDDEPVSSVVKPSAPSSSVVKPTASSSVVAPTKPVVEVAPVPTKSAAPSSSKAATPVSSKAPAPAPTPASSGEVITGGEATFYDQGGVAGNCGTVHSDSDFIIAVGFGRYGSTSQKSPLCGKQVKITNPANGKTITATIADSCESCGPKHIDLSRGAFNAIATEAQGLVTVNWSFI